jgi:hypothetical protein
LFANTAFLHENLTTFEERMKFLREEEKKTTDAQVLGYYQVYIGHLQNKIFMAQVLRKLESEHKELKPTKKGIQGDDAGVVDEEDGESLVNTATEGKRHIRVKKELLAGKWGACRVLFRSSSISLIPDCSQLSNLQSPPSPAGKWGACRVSPQPADDITALCDFLCPSPGVI